MKIKFFAQLQLTPYDYVEGTILRQSIPDSYSNFILFFFSVNGCFFGMEMQELQNNHKPNQ